MGLILNGNRNYEYLSTFIGAVILDKIPEFSGMVYVERMNDFDTADYPIINVMLQGVVPDRRDPVNSVSNCSVSIVVITDNLSDGNDNTPKTKAKVLEIVGKIDNLLCKQLNYQLKYKGKVIANFDHPQIDFSSTKVFNASGVVGAQITMNYTVEEDNNNEYEDLVEETTLLVKNQGKSYYWNDDNSPEPCYDAVDRIYDEDGNLLKIVTIPSGSTQSTTIGNSTAVLKDTGGNTLSTTPILAEGSEEIIAPDGVVALQNVNGDTFKTLSVESGGSLNVVAFEYLELSVDNTPQANIRIDNSSSSNTLAVWGDGSSELIASAISINHTYSSNYTGFINLYFLGGFSDVEKVRIVDSNSIYNFDLSVFAPLDNLDQIYLLSGNSIWTGNLNAVGNSVTYLRLQGNLSTWYGDIAELTNNLTYIYLACVLSTWTYSTKVWTTVPFILLRPAPSSMTSTMVDQLLIDLNASGDSGSETIDLRGNCGAPTAASATAITGLQALGHTVLTN